MRKLLLIIAFCCLTCMGSAQKTVTMKGTVRKITYPDTKGNTDLDNYDFGEEDNDEMEYEDEESDEKTQEPNKTE